MTSFGSYGEEPGRFDGPRGLCVDNWTGVVYVCDAYCFVPVFLYIPLSITIIGRIKLRIILFVYPQGVSRLLKHCVYSCYIHLTNQGPM